MNSIHFGEEHELLAAQIRRFVDEVVRPNGEAWEESGEVPRAVLRRMGELGFLGMRHPVEYGGAGADALTSAMFSEELGRSTFGGFTVTVLVHTDMASPHLRNSGTPAQLDRWMPKVVSGEVLTAIAVTEPDAGSDVAGMRTTARRDGDHWVLNGAKLFITNGASADLVIVAARTDARAKGSKGISMFLVERGTAGFSVGRKLEKFGWRSSDTAELVFEDCRVPGNALLGTLDNGFHEIMKNFQNERLVLSGMAVGESREALDRTIRYVKERRAFGATLWDKQVIRQRLAMLEARVEAARQLLYHSAWLMSRQVDAVREVSMLKALSGELVNEVMYACQQFHGGMGYVQETAIERMVRDARVLSIGGGATEIMLEEVAKRAH
ncbi:MAG: acyl-CoA dehydrogenase family protein [Candidatus Binatia bacterium]